MNNKSHEAYNTKNIESSNKVERGGMGMGQE
jgi:hypothetical protein